MGFMLAIPDPCKELSSLRSQKFSIGALAPLAPRNPPLAWIVPMSPLKGAYPLQTTLYISEFLRNSEMSYYCSLFFRAGPWL